MINKVEICGVNTAKLPVLSNEEKNALLMEIKEGNQEAREKFINGNLKLVLSVIKRFYGRGENLDDLFQIGCIGLIKAMDNFDLEQNVQFSTYAVPMIVGEIRRYLRDNNMVRVSRSVRDLAYKAIYAKEALMKQSEKEPGIEQIAKLLEATPEDVAFALDAIQSPVSLYEPVFAEGGDTLYIMDQISDKKNLEEDWVEKMSIKAAIDHLSEREHRIIKMRYYEGKTQMEVANEISISQAQVSRLEKRALKVMKQYL